MSDERNGGASGILLSFILGGLTGAALAILFAPRSGKETREILGERIREGRERGRQIRDKVVARSREMLDDAQDFVEEQRETLTRKKERLAAAVEAGRQAYKEEKEKGEA